MKYPKDKLGKEIGLIKIHRNYNLIRPGKGVTGVWTWLNSLSLDQIELLNKWVESDDPTEGAVVILAIVGLNGGEITEEEAERHFLNVKQHIRYRLQLGESPLYPADYSEDEEAK